MLDFDAGKLLIVGMVALVVVGPKDLPRVLRQVGQAVGKLRRMAGEFQGQFMEAVREADLQDLRDEVKKLQDTATLDVHFDHARDIQAELTKAVQKPLASQPLMTALPATVSSEDHSAALDPPALARPALDTQRPVEGTAGDVIEAPGLLEEPGGLEARGIGLSLAPSRELPSSPSKDAAVLGPVETEAVVRRKIVPVRRRDGTRIADTGPRRTQKAGFAPPRPGRDGAET